MMMTMTMMMNNDCDDDDDEDEDDDDDEDDDHCNIPKNSQKFKILVAHFFQPTWWMTWMLWFQVRDDQPSVLDCLMT